jgi:hypothetical protein
MSLRDPVIKMIIHSVCIVKLELNCSPVRTIFSNNYVMKIRSGINRCESGEMASYATEMSGCVTKISH